METQMIILNTLILLILFLVIAFLVFKGIVYHLEASMQIEENKKRKMESELEIEKNRLERSKVDLENMKLQIQYEETVKLIKERSVSLAEGVIQTLQDIDGGK